MPTATVPTDADVAVGRSIVYAFLTRGFAYPSSRHVTALVDDLVPSLKRIEFDDHTAIGPAVSRCMDALAADLPGLLRAHHRLFTIIESRDCPTYETAYRGRDIHQQGDIMADVAGFYRAHGVRFGGPERERPDRITVELEFMSFLAAKEAYARAQIGLADAVEECRRTQRLFLAEHLGTWGPAFGRRVRAIAATDFYATLGDLLSVWLEADMAQLDVTPTEVHDRPQPQPAPDDGATCGPDGATGGAWPVTIRRRGR